MNTKDSGTVHLQVFLHYNFVSTFVYVVSAFVIKLLRKLFCNYLCCCLQFAFYYVLGSHLLNTILTHIL